jgi:hypothetical protein
MRKKFNGKPVDMLTACQTITEQAIADEDFLSAQRPAWAAPFFSKHQSRIASAFTETLGVSNIAGQRKATQLVNSIHHEALDEIAILKIQIGQDFKKEPARRDEILKTLGFNLLSKKTRTSQEIFIQLLYQFKNNLTNELRNEISGKSIAVDLLDKIIAYADQMALANVTQEVLKGTTKVVSQKTMELLNDIYSDTITIAVIARRLFKDNKAKQDIYSYSKTLKKLQ